LEVDELESTTSSLSSMSPRSDSDASVEGGYVVVSEFLLERITSAQHMK
jgi:hypothetical protein